VRTRLASIDIARGFAILWVIAYHTWTDLRFPNVYPVQADAFREVTRQFGDADVSGALAAAGEAFLRVGYLGVPLFMMLSGYSLTLSARARGAAPQREARLLPRRLRRLLIPYWAGFAITVAFACALALVQWQRHGGAHFDDYLRNGDINLHNDQLLAGALLFPRILQDEWQFAPEGSLWFVLVVVQYYLLFPLLLAALVRSGPPLFAAATLAVTLVALAVMVAANGDLNQQRSWIEMAAPFRVVEFGAGMSLAYALTDRTGALRLLRTPAVGAASIAAGLAAFVAGCLIAPEDGYAAALQWPLIVAGLALVTAPFLAKSAGALESAPPARALGWIGVVSYTALIVNEPLRSVTHTMRAEHATTAWLTLWVVAGLLPLTFLIARPLALVLGLVERSAPPGLASPTVDAKAAESADASARH
jgi:peptidoglycan/LPS O-acetylase OafA/YrhL